MGAHDFTTYVEGKDAREAFRRATDEARSEYGSDPYNGTISTVAGFAYYDQGMEPVPMGATQALIEREWEREQEGNSRIQKWDTCLAIPVCADAAYRKRTTTRTVTVEGEFVTQEAAREAAAIPMDPGEIVLGTEIETLDKKTTVVSEATEGEGLWRYFVTDSYGRVIDHRDPDGFKTQAEARKAAERWSEKSGRESGVIGQRRREGGGVLVKVRPTTKNRVKVKVTIGKSKGAAPVKGWVFFGLAAS